MTAKPWLQSYAAGVPAEIDAPSGSLFDIIATSAAAYPDGAALEFFTMTTSYARLADQIDRAAAALHAAGVRAGDPVALVLPNCPQHIAAFYAVLDLQQPPPGAPDNGLSAETRTQFSPVAALGQDARSAPPILVARAGLDNPWLNDGVDRFVAAALSRGATLDLLTHPTGRHAFDILDDDARSKQIIRRAVEFLRAHLELVSQGS